MEIVKERIGAVYIALHHPASVHIVVRMLHVEDLALVHQAPSLEAVALNGAGLNLADHRGAIAVGGH